MSDIFTQSQAYQASSAPTIFSDQFVTGGEYQASSQACITDLTPPTFAGINALTVESRGQIRSKWLAATDPTSPIRYEVYIKASTSVGLFTAANIIAVTDKLQYDTFQMPDGSFLQNGVTYYVGVRAIDGVNNRDGNSVIMNVISTGVFVSADVYKSEGAFALNSSNQIQGTLWCLKNSILATPSNSVMGTAAYQIYDKTGAAVVGMSESGITADANGQYKITPVTSTLSTALDHYMIKVDITIDGALRSGYVPLIQKAPDYDLSGVFLIDTSNQFDGSFWVTADEQIKTTGLGSGSWQVYDTLGTPIVGMSGSGITADGNGIFKITAIPSLITGDTNSYAVRLSVVVDSITRTAMVPIQGHNPEYDSHGVFSINALNQFQATFWVTSDTEVVSGGRLGTANYTVYDSAGIVVAGLTQSGITADANGRFIATPVSAALLSDLTHYTVKIGIVIDGLERTSYRGFTLLGT